MTTTDYPISSVARNEWKDFALYTVESRAIPSIVDGLKPVQRFYIYSSIKNSSTDFKKVAAVAGIISEYGYNHGETSAAEAGKLMAAEWNNNICLVEGRGAFGSRLVQQGGAARYVYTRLHKNFGKYIKDLELAPEHPDPEHQPPRFYVPILPLVLANGTKGIATGFATNILPRSPEGLANAVNEYLKTGKIKNRVDIQFPDFSGIVQRDVDGKIFAVGTFERKSKTQLLITEVPYGYDREDYVKVLDGLEEDDKIVSYEDLCDKTGFKFEIKLKAAAANSWDDERIIKEFKLSKTFSENLTVIDQHGNLKEYADERDLIKDFCDFRLSILDQRIALHKSKAEEDFRWLSVKLQFVEAVLDEKIVFRKNMKKEDVETKIFQYTAATQDDADRLLKMHILAFTDEMVGQLKKELDEMRKTIKYWSETNPKDQFLKDLKEVN